MGRTTKAIRDRWVRVNIPFDEPGLPDAVFASETHDPESRETQLANRTMQGNSLQRRLASVFTRHGIDARTIVRGDEELWIHSLSRTTEAALASHLETMQFDVGTRSGIEKLMNAGME